MQSTFRAANAHCTWWVVSRTSRLRRVEQVLLGLHNGPDKSGVGTNRGMRFRKKDVIGRPLDFDNVEATVGIDERDVDEAIRIGDLTFSETATYLGEISSTNFRINCFHSVWPSDEPSNWLIVRSRTGVK
jgi:hypothetical protein